MSMGLLTNQMWSSVSPLTITETLRSNDSNIFLQYATEHHGDNFPFDGEGGVLAHAFYPDSGSLAGQVHFDDSESWSHENQRGTLSQHFLATPASLWGCYQRPELVKNYHRLTVFTARSLAERGVAKASCLSVCLSVCNVEVS